MRHRHTGYQLLHGKGMEVGAFHLPAQLPADCSVTYADVGSRKQLLQNYPELTPESLAQVDVVVNMDKTALACFPNSTFDFVVMNQVVAHVANPLRAVEEAFRVVRPGGLVVISSHDKSYSFDKKRNAPAFGHLLEEYRQRVDVVADDHYEAFLRAAHPYVFHRGEAEVAAAMRAVRARREHAHAWDSAAFRNFLEQALILFDIHAVKRFESIGQENKLEYFSVWQKYEKLGDLAAIIADSNRQFVRISQRLQEKELLVEELRRELAVREARLVSLTDSRSWRLTAPLRVLQRSLGKARQMLRVGKRHVLGGALPVADTLGNWDVAPVVNDHGILPHQASVDVIVCVHNAQEDVERCLSSIIRYTFPPYNLVLVDDGSDEPTRDYLQRFASDQNARLIRNECARGYTFAANQGLRASQADYVVLLNSDTLVTPDWLDRMAMCAESDRAIGIVGPLSNTASWQSVPLFEVDGDWAKNPLPSGVAVEQMATWIACRSARLYPRLPFLNGFCLMIARAVIDDIGYFDEDAFGRGYGEENDYCLRARKAGWDLAVADDTYVFHAQSKSYSDERRRVLCEQAGSALVGKHGAETVERGVNICREDRVLQGLRARAGLMFERQAVIDRGQDAWEGKRVLFIMPVMAAGGGANVVISEARAMIAMGVDARILNLKQHLGLFKDNYPDLEVPVIYADKERDFAAIASRYDAVVATGNQTVQWLKPLAQAENRPVIAYYIQDFEPHFYAQDADEYRIALESYTAIPDMVRITKTEWNRAEVLKITGVDSIVVGPSCEVDLFMPRNRRKPTWPAAPLRLCAMVRPGTGRRNPLLTMRVLRSIQHAYEQQVEIVIFGVRPEDTKFLALPRDFSFTNCGERTPGQMAALLNEMDIFADFSTYQAMGLTAMEAMGCGAAVILPQAGGSGSFAVDEGNALIVDTSDERECYKALERLIVDHDLRLRLQRRTLVDVVRFSPENAAFNILQALFGKAADG